MPRRKILPSMNWMEAPDTVDPKIVAKILGCSSQTAEKYFNEKDFPLLDKCGLKADKEAARLYFQGIRFKDNGKNALLSMIYFELKKLNSKISFYEEAEEKIS